MKLVSAILDAKPHHYGAISIGEWKILSGVCVVFKTGIVSGSTLTFTETKTALKGRSVAPIVDGMF